jgi:hypothetical protein
MNDTAKDADAVLPDRGGRDTDDRDRDEYSDFLKPIP